MEASAHEQRQSDPGAPPKLDDPQEWSSRSRSAAPVAQSFSPKLAWIAAIVLTVALVAGGVALVRALPKIGKLQHEARRAKIEADLCEIDAALECYASRNGGAYPASLEALVARDDEGTRCLEHASVPRDPWRQAYRYDPPTQGHPHGRVYTYGRDQTPGGTGDNADIDDSRIRSSKPAKR